MDGGLWRFRDVFGAVVWLAVVVLFVWGMSALFARRTSSPQMDALEILRRRFAAGEISAAEFETARRVLA